MADINLKGMGVALITPFKEDESVDYEALGKLVDYQVQNGTDYLVVLGTTAETPTLTEEEKKNIISLVVTRVRGRIPIVLKSYLGVVPQNFPSHFSRDHPGPLGFLLASFKSWITIF